jgi:hypothetical protein
MSQEQTTDKRPWIRPALRELPIAQTQNGVPSGGDGGGLSS